MKFLRKLAIQIGSLVAFLVAFTGAKAQSIAPPSNLVGVTECIAAARMHAGPDETADAAAKLPRHSVGVGATEGGALNRLTYSGIGYMLPPTSGEDRCAGFMLGEGDDAVSIANLSGQMERIVTRIGAKLGTNPDADDLDENLDELRDEFDGPIFDAFVEEYRAFLAVRDAENDYNDVQMSDGTSPSADNDPEDWAFNDLVTQYRQIAVPQGETGDNDHQIMISSLLDNDSTGLDLGGLPTVTNADKEDAALVASASPYAPTAGVFSSTITFDDLGQLLDAQESLTDRIGDYNDLLNNDDFEFESRQQREFIGSLVEAGNIALNRVNAALEKAEGAVENVDSGSIAEQRGENIIDAFGARRQSLKPAQRPSITHALAL